MELTEDRKFQALLGAYRAWRSESVIWRERGWRVTAGLATLLIILTASGTLGTVVESGKSALTGVVALVTLVGTVYLQKCYFKHSACRRVLAEIEKCLGFFDEGVYRPGATLIPVRGHYPSKVSWWAGTLWFTLTVWLLAVAAMVALWYRPTPS